MNWTIDTHEIKYVHEFDEDDMMSNSTKCPIRVFQYTVKASTRWRHTLETEGKEETWTSSPATMDKFMISSLDSCVG